MDINNHDGWFFPNPQENKIHILTDEEIDQLFTLSAQEEQWVKDVRREVEHYDKHPCGTGADWIVNKFQIMNTGGTIIRYPFNLSVISFSSRRHLFRGEPQVYSETLPSLNRKIKGSDEKDRLSLQAVADMRATQFFKFIWKINVVPYWEAKLSDVNHKALAQHYGFDTNLLDLTNDIRVALFFATCKYEAETDSYRPLTKDECEKRGYGVIFHTPDWRVDCYNGANLMKLTSQMGPQMDQPLNIEDGSCDGVAFQIGLQPLMRCHHQSGYILPMVNDAPLQKNWNFEKLYIKLSPELSDKVFRMMDSGKKVFPNEGIGEARDILDMIKKSTLFSEDDLNSAYEKIGSKLYKSVGDFRIALEGLPERIKFQKQDVDYPISTELLDRINAKYDNKDLLEPVGGMLHMKPEDRKYREQKCIEIYGKLI